MMQAPLRDYSTHIYEMMARLGIERALEFYRNLVCGMQRRFVDAKIADLKKLARTG